MRGAMAERVARITQEIDDQLLQCFADMASQQYYRYGRDQLYNYISGRSFMEIYSLLSLRLSESQQRVVAPSVIYEQLKSLSRYYIRWEDAEYKVADFGSNQEDGKPTIYILSGFINKRLGRQ
jgi:hypothetical protein